MKYFVLALLLVCSLPAAESQLCTQCQQIVGAIEQWVENNATVAQIVQYLDQYCALNPAFELECDAIVAYGVPTIVQWLQQNGSPATICKALGICKATSSGLHKSMKPIRVRDDFCTYCQTVISSIENWLAQNQTEAQIIQNLDQLCNLLPNGFNIYCQVFIAGEIPTIIKYIEQNYTPNQVCSNIGLCASKKTPSPLKIH